MRKRSKRLQTVLKLAQLRQQQAAERLGEHQRAANTQNQKKKQLESYQTEYNEQFKSLGKQPVGAARMSNYIQFYNSLDSAIKTQLQSTLLAEKLLEQSRSQWQTLYSKQKNMETLVEITEKEEDREYENKIQRTLDDRVMPNKESF